MNLVLTACDLHVTLNWPIASFQGFEAGTRKIQSDFLAGKDSSIRENPSVFIGNHGVVENNVPFITDKGVRHPNGFGLLSGKCQVFLSVVGTPGQPIIMVFLAECHLNPIGLNKYNTTLSGNPSKDTKLTSSSKFNGPNSLTNMLTVTSNC